MLSNFRSALLGVLLLPTLAHASIIDFDDPTFVPGQIIDDEYSALGVTINGVNYRDGRIGNGNDFSNAQVVFSTNNPTGGDSDLGAPFSNSTLGPLSPGNVLILHERPGQCDAPTRSCSPDDEGSRPAGYFEFIFTDPVTLTSVDFFDVETPENGRRPENEVELFDAAGNPILDNSFYTPDTGGDNRWARLDLGVDGVSRMVINMGGSGAIDNIRFQPVPEPGTLALLGSGLLGLAFRRRKHSTTV